MAGLMNTFANANSGLDGRSSAVLGVSRASLGQQRSAESERLFLLGHESECSVAHPPTENYLNLRFYFFFCSSNFNSKELLFLLFETTTKVHSLELRREKKNLKIKGEENHLSVLRQHFHSSEKSIQKFIAHRPFHGQHIKRSGLLSSSLQCTTSRSVPSPTKVNMKSSSLK